MILTVICTEIRRYLLIIISHSVVNHTGEFNISTVLILPGQNNLLSNMRFYLKLTVKNIHMNHYQLQQKHY